MVLLKLRLAYANVHCLGGGVYKSEHRGEGDKIQQKYCVITGSRLYININIKQHKSEEKKLSSRGGGGQAMMTSLFVQRGGGGGG